MDFDDVGSFGSGDSDWENADDPFEFTGTSQNAKGEGYDDGDFGEGDPQGLYASDSADQPWRLRQTVLSLDNIKQRQAEDVAKFNEVFCIPEARAYGLLRHNKWQTEALITKYMEQPAQCLLEAQLIPPPPALLKQQQLIQQQLKQASQSHQAAQQQLNQQQQQQHQGGGLFGRVLRSSTKAAAASGASATTSAVATASAAATVVSPVNVNGAPLSNVPAKQPPMRIDSAVANFIVEQATSALPRIERGVDFMCEVCFANDPESGSSLSLICGHRFCSDCWGFYLRQKIAEEGVSAKINCMADKCTIIVDSATVKQLVTDDIYQKYEALLCKDYVAEHGSIKWCPEPDCDSAVECRIPAGSQFRIVPSVSCKCERRFCFSCKLENAHDPCICHLANSWVKKCSDESETANWMSAHTKDCPKCQSAIEKNGGCNHMTCRKCNYHFCWVCMGPWTEHGQTYYNCNRFNEDSSKDARSKQEQSRKELERYLHHFRRYENHMQSLKFEKKMLSDIQSKCFAIIQSTSMSWIEVKFLVDAARALNECRDTLMWTYVFGYYLVKNNQVEIFFDNQRDLEVAVENLAELLEGQIDMTKINELRERVLHYKSYVVSRRNILLDDTAQGMYTGRWEYNVPIPGLTQN
ncbi:hypothetical protein GQ42DRAFT_163139 [Ramicandelaber brevisporus]|nr:hypothetical protein GQ42DRAFT_163139 [Ramicandelaber brevisporus]